MTPPQVVVVMGVSGTGKTTVGRLLADELAVAYAEADSFHPPANIAKMSAGTPLDDADREPWLDAIAAWARERVEHAGAATSSPYGVRGVRGVVSCSALKRAYRDRLRGAGPGVFFLHLDGPPELITERLGGRQGHFMPRTLLDSQYADLQPLQADEAGVVLSVAEDPESIVRKAVTALERAAGADNGSGQATG
ncbi:gluconokinase [Streptomyces oceani]|uniref:Gluconokinase n=1 Tax=Streptomyces oceani TaxID=1075402 RepID=A0A1E7KIB9_9ACTN|nr:gluconokinase [Streptomyces oceani]OEV03616.1 gluconate kinase [Streptomyces oceani]